MKRKESLAEVHKSFITARYESKGQRRLKKPKKILEKLLIVKEMDL